MVVGYVFNDDHQVSLAGWVGLCVCVGGGGFEYVWEVGMPGLTEYLPPPDILTPYPTGNDT